MNYHTTAQLAELRRQELVAEATYYRQARHLRTRKASNRRRPLSGFHGWLAGGQL